MVDITSYKTDSFIEWGLIDKPQNMKKIITCLISYSYVNLRQLLHITILIVEHIKN